MATVADLTGLAVTEIDAARDTLVKKAAVALGYVTEAEAGVTVRRIVDPIPVRRETVKAMYESGLSMNRVADRIGISAATVYNDLKALGVQTRQPHTGKPR